MSASVIRGQSTLHAVVRVRGTIMQDETRDDTILTSAELERYRKVIEHELQLHATNTLRQLQLKQVDAYGFGRYILIHNPWTKSQISTKWPTMFANAKVDIRVKVVQLQKGTLM